MFAVDSKGSLSPVPGSPFPAGDFPFRIAFGAAGTFVYVETENNGGQGGGASSISAYRLNSATGALVELAGSPFALPGNGYINTNATGTALYLPIVNGLAGYAINQDTGALTALPGSPYPAGADSIFVAIEPSGRFLYQSDCAGNAVYGYSIAASGALTPVPGSPFAASSCPFWTVSTTATSFGGASPPPPPPRDIR